MVYALIVLVIVLLCAHYYLKLDNTLVEKGIVARRKHKETHNPMMELYKAARSKCPLASSTSPNKHMVDIGMGVVFEFTKFRNSDGTFRYDMMSPSYDDVGIITSSTDTNSQPPEKDNSSFNSSDPFMWL